ncbi:MAG TPA: hypothetical protein VIE40_00175 [Dehalococcoidia bacterium]
MSNVEVSARILRTIDTFLASSSDSDPFEEAHRKLSIWHREYQDLFFHRPTDSLGSADLDYFSDIDEHAYWVSNEKWPIDEDISYGLIRLSEFVQWLRSKRTTAPIR